MVLATKAEHDLAKLPDTNTLSNKDWSKPIP